MDAWLEELKNKKRDIVVRYLSGVLDQFKDAYPLFKMCIGEAFEKEHWKTLFHYLKFGKEVSVETLTFQHFVDAIDTMVKKANDIKDLSARAQGEVTIREAIHELHVWCD